MKLTTGILWILPKRTLTAVVGAFSRHPLSRRLIPFYIKKYHIDITEAELCPHEYSSLGAFFSRRLRPGCRLPDKADILSPVDGTIQEFGEICGGKLLQAKGAWYTVGALLANVDDAAAFERGYYVTLYLSPRDYHRIHMPMDGILTSWRYVPGTLYPVNPVGVHGIPGLFTKNERVVTMITTAWGPLALVKIGATIVGSVRTPYIPNHPNALFRKRCGLLEGKIHLPQKKGEEVGYFEFGSTVILLFPPNIPLEWVVEKGEFLRMGQGLAKLATGNALQTGLLQNAKVLSPRNYDRPQRVRKQQ